MWIGVGVATVVSLAFGAILTLGPQGLSFEAQEAIGGMLSIIAVGLVTWMIFWMARNARSMKGELEGSMESAISVGSGAVVAMALLAVGREGLETALFLWAGIQSAGTTRGPRHWRHVGLVAAAALGVLIYRGAVTLNLRVFFQWTGVFLVVIAAGVLAYGVHDLQEAGRPSRASTTSRGTSPRRCRPRSIHRHVPQGNLQLLRADDRARGRRLLRVPHPRDVPLCAHGVLRRPRPKPAAHHSSHPRALTNA